MIPNWPARAWHPQNHCVDCTFGDNSSASAKLTSTSRGFHVCHSLHLTTLVGIGRLGNHMESVVVRFGGSPTRSANHIWCREVLRPPTFRSDHEGSQLPRLSGLDISHQTAINHHHRESRSRRVCIGVLPGIAAAGSGVGCANGTPYPLAPNHLPANRSASRYRAPCDGPLASCPLINVVRFCVSAFRRIQRIRRQLRVLENRNGSRHTSVRLLGFVRDALMLRAVDIATEAWLRRLWASRRGGRELNGHSRSTHWSHWWKPQNHLNPANHGTWLLGIRTDSAIAFATCAVNRAA